MSQLIWSGQHTKFRYLSHNYAQMLLINTHDDMISYPRGLNFILSLHLHPYFVYVSRKGSGESDHMCRLAFAAHQGDKGKTLI